MARLRVWCCAAAVELLPGPAAAQATAGWALDRYEPTPAGDVFFVADHPRYAPSWSFVAGLTVEHAVNPLVFREDGNDSATNRVVSGMLVGHAGIALSFVGRVGVALSLPVSLLQSGETWTDGTTTVAPSPSVAPGDLRVSARVRLLGRADADAFSLHLGASLWLPSGDVTANTGDGALRAEPRVIVTGRAGALLWSATLGVAFRPTASVQNVGLGAEARASVALGASLAGGRLTVGPEAYVVSPVGSDPSNASAFFARGHWGGEALVGAHYRFGSAILTGLGGGVGLERGYGVPAARALVSVAYAPATDAPSRAAPRPPDADGDGLVDAEDRCPTVRGGVHPDPARPGCPPADVDGDGVVDDDDRCVREPEGAQPDRTQPGCPLRDRDSDGVFDPDDACPAEPVGARPDPTRRGCPAGDRDGDGVADHADACPVEVPGLFPDAARAGCPLADADGDFVPEPPDACPAQAGVPSPDPRRNGCPDPRVSLRAGAIRVARPIVFSRNRDQVKRDSNEALQAVADLLRAAPFIRRVVVEAHVEEHGSAERDQDLSARRANAVMRWLIQRGVAAERLEARGFGHSRPVASNDTPEGRERNRRVEFRVADPAPPGGDATGPAPAAPAAAPEEPREGRHGRTQHRGRRHR